MDKKISYALAILVPVIIVVALLFALSGQKEQPGPVYDPAWGTCNVDGDCIEVSTPPCGDYPCGGLAINEKYQSDYQSYLNKVTKDYVAQGKECSPNCIAPTAKEPKCVQSKCKMVETIVTDAHGCRTSARYTWCEEKQKCLKASEEPCTIPAFGEKLAEDANKLWGNSSIYWNTGEVAQEGWLRTSFNVPDAANYTHICAIFMRKDRIRTTDNRTYFVDHGPTAVNGKEVCEIGMIGGVVEACGNLTIRIDINSMKTGYNKTRDNWQDFITCETGKGSSFCNNECRLLLEGLMMQKREDITISPAMGGYCKTASDCKCLSGSGVQLVGCGNSTIASTWFAGSYECDKCACQNSRCVKASG